MLSLSCVALWVLGQLVHIHNVGQRAQLVEGFQCAVPFDPMLPVEEEQYRCTDKHHRANAGVQRLH